MSFPTMPMETFWKDDNQDVSPQPTAAHAPPASQQQRPDLGGEVLLSGEGLSEGAEAVLDQVVQITWEDHSKIRTSARLADTHT